jgi:protein TonB
MKGANLASFGAAVLLMGGLLLFGGLLFFPLHGPRKAKIQDVSIEETAKPDEPDEAPPKELEVEKQARPEAPPELKETSEPLDLNQLEMALNPSLGDGGGDFLSRAPASLAMHAASAAANAETAAEQVFALADLDQLPRAVYQPAPEYPAMLRKQRLDGTVHVLFVVDRGGRVDSPIVQKTTHPAFEPAALQAVKRWRFEPGKRNGEAVAFRMRIPITFKSR